jgi:hypothetical protein
VSIRVQEFVDKYGSENKGTLLTKVEQAALEAFTDTAIADALTAVQIWLPAVKTKVLLPAPSSISDRSTAYLCRVVKENNVYQLVPPNQTDPDEWVLYSEADAYVPSEVAKVSGSNTDTVEIQTADGSLNITSTRENSSTSETNITTLIQNFERFTVHNWVHGVGSGKGLNLQGGKLYYGVGESTNPSDEVVTFGTVEKFISGGALWYDWIDTTRITRARFFATGTRQATHKMVICTDDNKYIAFNGTFDPTTNQTTYENDSTMGAKMLLLTSEALSVQSLLNSIDFTKVVAVVYLTAIPQTNLYVPVLVSPEEGQEVSVTNDGAGFLVRFDKAYSEEASTSHIKVQEGMIETATAVSDDYSLMRLSPAGVHFDAMGSQLDFIPGGHLRTEEDVEPTDSSEYIQKHYIDALSGGCTWEDWA